MSELSDRTGVPVATIKFYLREGLLPERELTSPNQAVYAEEHVARLKLLRALIDAGGLSVASVRTVLAAIDDTELPLDHAFGCAQRAIPGGVPPEESATGTGLKAVSNVLNENGWQIGSGNPGAAMAARVLDTYERLELDHLAEVLPDYLRAAEIVADADLRAVTRARDRAEMVETVVVGIVLGDSLFAGLRRIAQERASHTYFPAPSTENDCDEDLL